MIEAAAISLLPGVVQAVSRWIGHANTDKNASQVIRRALANELRLNLGIIDSVLGKGALECTTDVTLIRAVVNRLETTVSEAVFGGIGTELVNIKVFDNHILKVLKNSAGKSQPLPHAILKSKKMDFTALLGFVLRKIAEMKAISSIQNEMGEKLNVSTQWATRMQNLRQVMLFLMKNLQIKF